MMRRLLRWLIGVPLVLLVIAFAVANRQSTIISLDPFSTSHPFAAVEMPLWALLFCGLFLGVIVGWIGCWFAQAKWRRALKDTRQQLARLELAHQDLLRQQEKTRPVATLPDFGA